MKNKKYLPLYIIFSTFFISRVVFLFAGGEFDYRLLVWGPQFIDPILLKSKLLESLFYLASQPPLFNLILGIVLKIFPQNYPIAFQLLFMLTGAIFFTSTYYLMLRLKVKDSIALILTLIFMVNPSVILLENYLIYTYFSGAWMTLSALFLHRYLSEQKALDGLIFFSLLACLALTISAMHLFWLLAMVGLVICHNKRKWRHVLAVCCLPLLIVLLIYVKNFCLFGSFTLSKSWLGDQLLNIAFKPLSDEEVKRLYREKKISIYSTTTRWTEKEKERYGLVDEFYREIDKLPKTNIDILDQIKKPSSKDISWHSNAHMLVGEYQLKDSLYVLRRFPQNLLKSMRRTFLVYFFPSPTDTTFKNRKVIANYENAYNFMFAYLNKINDRKLYDEKLLLWYHFDNIKWDLLSIFLMGSVIFFYIFVVCFGIGRLLKSYRKPGGDTPFNGTLLFIIFNILYVTVVMNLFGWFANNRYRFMLDAFYLILFGLVLTYVYQKWKQGVPENDKGQKD